MALTPVAEGPLNLTVAEAFVPMEVLDERHPGGANRREPRRPEAQRNASAPARRNRRLRIGEGLAGSGVQFDVLDARLLPVGVQLWQVCRIREEGKHRLDGVRQPLRCAKTMTHFSRSAPQ